MQDKRFDSHLSGVRKGKFSLAHGNNGTKALKVKSKSKCANFIFCNGCS